MDSNNALLIYFGSTSFAYDGYPNPKLPVKCRRNVENVNSAYYTPHYRDFQNVTGLNSLLPCASKLPTATSMALSTVPLLLTANENKRDTIKSCHILNVFVIRMLCGEDVGIHIESRIKSRSPHIDTFPGGI